MNGSVGERYCFSLVPLGCLREAEKVQAGLFLSLAWMSYRDLELREITS